MEVSIVTPIRKLVEGEKTSAIRLPGAKGQLEILEGHSPMLSILTTGIVSFNNKNYAVSYGFVQVEGEKVTLLAETCEEASEIDLDRAKEALAKAQEKLNSTLSESDFKKYQLKLERAIVRQGIAG